MSGYQRLLFRIGGGDPEAAGAGTQQDQCGRHWREAHAGPEEQVR